MKQQPALKNWSPVCWNFVHEKGRYMVLAVMAAEDQKFPQH